MQASEVKRLLPYLTDYECQLVADDAEIDGKRIGFVGVLDKNTASERLLVEVIPHITGYWWYSKNNIDRGFEDFFKKAFNLEAISILLREISKDLILKIEYYKPVTKDAWIQNHYISDETVCKYQVMPDLSSEEYADLKEDIAKRGVMVPIEFDEYGNILDGHHRIRACMELGITDYPQIIRNGLSDDEKRFHARKLNMARRHLTQEQRRGLVREQLIETPEKSDRQIAAGLGVSNSTVSTTRKEMVADNQLCDSHTSIGADGKEYPRQVERKPVAIFNPTPPEFDEINYSASDEVYERNETRPRMRDDSLEINGDEVYPVTVPVANDDSCMLPEPEEQVATECFEEVTAPPDVVTQKDIVAQIKAGFKDSPEGKQNAIQQRVLGLWIKVMGLEETDEMYEAYLSDMNFEDVEYQIERLGDCIKKINRIREHVIDLRKQMCRLEVIN